MTTHLENIENCINEIKDARTKEERAELCNAAIGFFLAWQTSVERERMEDRAEINRLGNTILANEGLMSAMQECDIDMRKMQTKLVDTIHNLSEKV